MFGLFSKPCAVCAEKDKRISELKSDNARLMVEIEGKDKQIASYLQAMLDMSQQITGMQTHVEIEKPIIRREFDFNPLPTSNKEEEAAE